MWLSNVTIQVWPSGGDLAAAVAPITPAAPGLFSTTTFQPVFSASLAWMMRAIGSVPPPGGKGTMNLIGPFGQSAWALTRGTQRVVPRLPASTTRRRKMAIVSLPDASLFCREPMRRGGWAPEGSAPDFLVTRETDRVRILGQERRQDLVLP